MHWAVLCLPQPTVRNLRNRRDGGHAPARAYIDGIMELLMQYSIAVFPSWNICLRLKTRPVSEYARNTKEKRKGKRILGNCCWAPRRVCIQYATLNGKTASFSFFFLLLPPPPSGTKSWALVIKVYILFLSDSFPFLARASEISRP